MKAERRKKVSCRKRGTCSECGVNTFGSISNFCRICWARFRDSTGIFRVGHETTKIFSDGSYIGETPITRYLNLGGYY